MLFHLEINNSVFVSERGGVGWNRNLRGRGWANLKRWWGILSILYKSNIIVKNLGGQAIETLEHCFIRSKWVEIGWARIFKWWNLGNFNCGTIDDVLSHEGKREFSSKLILVWQVVVWSTIYLIWGIRNKVVFKNR